MLASSRELLERARAEGITPCIVPVAHYPGPAVETILYDLWEGPTGACDAVTYSAGVEICYGVGGLARSRYSRAANAWYRRFLHDLEEALAKDNIDPDALQLHVFGIGRPSWVQQSPYIASVDSAGPARMAGFGWKKIRPIWEGLPADVRGRMGVTEQSEALLSRSRAARLAFMICYYRSRLGLPWTSIPLDTLMSIDERAARQATIIPFPTPRRYQRVASGGAAVAYGPVASTSRAGEQTHILDWYVPGVARQRRSERRGLQELIQMLC